MDFIKTNKLEECWKELIYPPKQLGKNTLDLTVNKVFSVCGQGVLDFGGSEFQPAKLIPIDPKMEEDPKYGWWNLVEGQYIVEYNERISRNDCLAIVFPHNRLLMTGCNHSPFIAEISEEDQPIQGLLHVNKEGVRIKQNARISIALSFSID